MVVKEHEHLADSIVGKFSLENQLIDSSDKIGFPTKPIYHSRELVGIGVLKPDG